MQSYLLGKESLSSEQAYAADIIPDAVPNVFDMVMLRKMIAE